MDQRVHQSTSGSSERGEGGGIGSRVLRVSLVQSTLSRERDFVVPSAANQLLIESGRVLSAARSLRPRVSSCSVSGGPRATRRNASLILVALFAMCSSCARGTVSQAGVTSPQPAQDSGEIVRAGDVIRLKIWREPDMSGDIGVDEGGVATLPRLGRLTVANVPADSLKRMLISSYTKYLRDPAIDVTVLRRITVLGAVRTPNVYHVEPTMTVADALAMAGGAAPDGKVNQVELRRRDHGPPVILTRGTRLADTPIRSGDELFVPQRSWFSRNAGLVFGAVGTTVSVLYFVFRHH
jgi:protein involved in polysaccharide export with SLBB domain